MPRLRRLLPAGVIALVVAWFFPLLRAAFLTANDFDLLPGPAPWRALWNASWFDWLPRHPGCGLLVRATAWLLFGVFGFTDWTTASFCLTAHLAACRLAYGWILGLTDDRAGAAWATAFFAVLPAHVLAAAHLWTTLMHIGAAASTLVALRLFLCYLETGRAARLAGSLAAFAAGLGFHEATLTALALAPIWASRPSSRRFPARRWAAAAPHLALAAVYAAAEIAAYLGRLSNPQYTPEGYRLGLHALANAAAYAGELLWPSEPLKVPAPVIIGVAAVLWFGRRRIAALQAQAALSLCVALLPFLFFLSPPGLHGAIYMYLPSVFLCLLLGVSAAGGGRAGRGAAIAMLAVWTLKSWTIADHHRRRMEPQRLALAGMQPRICSARPPVHVRWPEAGRYWLHEGRLEAYYRLRCGKEDLRLVLLDRRPGQ